MTSPTMPSAGLSSAQLARPIRIAAAFLTLTSVTRALMETLSGGPAERAELPLRAVQILILIAIAAWGSPHRSVIALLRMGFILALTVPLANLVVITIDPKDTWGAVAILVALTLGAALFAPWSWRWQAALCAIFLASAAITILGFVPRAAFPWSDVGFALFLIVAASAGSIWGSVIKNHERHLVSSSEARFRSLFESAGDAIAVLDGDGVIRQANPRLADLLGQPLERLVGRTLADFSVTSERGPTKSSEHVIALTGAPARAAHTLRHADGHPIEVEVTYARTDGGAEPFVQAIIRDLTERRMLERREIKDQRANALEGLAGGMAHQFNNILGGILTHATVLRDDARNVEAAAELDEIIVAARRGRDLTKELLSFTRSEPLALKPVAPGALLESLAALARTTVPENVPIDMRVGTGLPAMQADADHLAHALLELVLNARDAMQGLADARLTLAATTLDVVAGDPTWPGAMPGRYVKISVTDTGRGMDAVTRDRLFEPFFTTKPMHRAAGMGLAMVYGVVRDHKGGIHIESTRGRGTSVHVIVPVSAEPAPAPAVTAVSVPDGPATILVVDDEAIVRHSLRRALKKFGYHVLEAIDGPTALAELQSANPPVRLVILDLVLPGGGAGILELLRALRPDLKVLVSSGYSPEAETVKSLMGRVEGFLPKPYEITQLREAVNKALAG